MTASDARYLAGNRVRGNTNPQGPVSWKWLTRTQDGQSAGRLSQVVQMSGVETGTMAHSTRKPGLSCAMANVASWTPSGHVCTGFRRLVI